MSEATSGRQYDAPNQEVVGQSPPWVEGEGGQPRAEEAQPETEPETGTTDLDDMTKDELLAEAQRLGVSPANASMTKDEIRAAIDAQPAGE
jgi:hypothetical protein